LGVIFVAWVVSLFQQSLDCPIFIQNHG
jgi:hypothetical protein